MITTAELNAYRLSERLVLAVYESTNTLPKQAGEGLVRRLRGAAIAAGSSLLDGCASVDPERRRRRWEQTLALLEAIGEAVDVAADAGWWAADTVLALLELQSGFLVQVLALADSLAPAHCPVVAPALAA